MSESYLDKVFHTFECENPKCGEPFKQLLRSLVHAKEVTCPKCRTVIDIRESKVSGQIGLDFNTADEQTKKLHEKK